MRVIHQEGRPLILRTGDLEGNGRDELIVVNSQHSRLDIYSWIPAGERTDPGPADPDRPNDLPMPADFRREELPLKYLPQGLVLEDLDEDGKLELVVLVAPPNKIHVYGRDEEGKRELRETFDLLPGELAPRHEPLLVRRSADGDPEVLVGCSNGIQRLTLKPGSRPKWLTPREQRGREDWWVADVDGDGDQDLVEQSRESHQSLRWFECASSGRLMPAQVLFDRAIHGAKVMQVGEGAAQVLLLDGATTGLLRRYRLGQGKASRLGRQRPLALKGGNKAVWCGLQVGDSPALVVADRQRPQLLMYRLGPDGWDTQQTYPTINDVRAIAAPQARPGTLLLWAENAAELHVSRWEGGRMSYPKPWPQPQSQPQTKDVCSILGLDSVGSTTWWLRQAGDDCELYVWAAGQSAPERTRFDAVNIKKGGHVQWLGDGRLLARRDYRDAPRLIEKDGDKTVTAATAHLKQVPVDELKLVAVDGEIRVARRCDGVLQWLDKALHPVDQIMLPQDRKLADYAALDKARGWALEEEGRYIHLLETDETGIAQVKETIEMNGGVALVQDAVLGLMLVDQHHIVSLEAGQPHELELAESIDGRIDRRSGVKEATIHRICCLDIDGDRDHEVLLFDDRRHQLSVLARKDGKLTPQISWPVFEDKKYPYADGKNTPTIKEPRVVVAFDADGDGYRDLAMACHDRVLIYLAHDEP